MKFNLVPHAGVNSKRKLTRGLRAAWTRARMGMYNKRTLSAINVPFESRETYIFHIKARVFNGCLKVLMFLCFCKILDTCVVIVWWGCLHDFCSGCWDCAIDCVTWVAFWCCFFPRWPSRPNAFGAPSAGGFNALIFLSSGMSSTKKICFLVFLFRVCIF